MGQQTPALPDFLAQQPLIGDEISVTGKWVPATSGGRFRKSTDTQEMLEEWDDIHTAARETAGVLSTEINHAVGEEAVLIHHVFENPDALVNYFSTTANEHLATLGRIARPELQLVRGTKIPDEARQIVTDTGAPVAFGEWRYGYVRNEYKRPDPATAIQVTAKWTCIPGEDSKLDELEHWWQAVGTDAHSMEQGLLRFETYRAIGEDALIIHETFADTSELKFHLTKGTAAKYKKDIDAIAAPEAYYFRGPVSWTIRTYSKFMHLPATYSSQGRHFSASGGNMSDGVVAEQ